LQDPACDFGGKLRDGSFDVAASSREFSRDAHFRGADFACGFRARILICAARSSRSFLRAASCSAYNRPRACLRAS